MKFFTVFAAIVAVALASPAEWTLNELSVAIQDPNTPAALKPVLEQALSDLMMEMMTGSPQTTTTVSTAVQDFSSWTLHDLSEALQDPATDPQLVVYLEHALNSMMADIMSGGQPEYVIVATPVGLLPVEAVIVPTPVETVVVPTPVESVVVPAPAAASSPLVQIIVNIKSQEQQTPVVPSPVVLPEPAVPEVNPVDIISINPQPVVLPQPVLPEVVIPEPVVLPQPVLPEVVIPEPVVLPLPILPEVVIPEPVVLPLPVLPEVEVNPIDIISVNPEGAINPVDVIAITAPEVNPIDILAPVPVITPVGAVDVVGPLV